jgi:hypothetical protein
MTAPLPSVMTDDEVLREVATRDGLLERLLCALPDATIYAESTRRGRLPIAQPEPPNLAELAALVSEADRFLMHAHEGRVGFGPVVIVPRTDGEQLQALRRRLHQALARLA